MHLNKLLVPLDGSAFGEQALPWACSLAERTGAELQLVSVSPPHPRRAPPAGHRAYLDDLVSRLRQVAPRLTLHPTLLDGRPAERVAEQAEHADLVVLTTHGWGPVGRAWFGSVTDELVRRPGGPLLLVRPRAGQVALRARPVPRRVFITLDGSPLAEQVLAPAIAVGTAWETDFRLVRAVRVDPRKGWPEVVEDQEAAKQYLMQTWDQLPVPRQGARWRTRALLASDIAPAISALARSDDLIALCTRGQGGVRRMLLGSVADKVIRHAAGPLLIQRAPAGGAPQDPGALTP